MSDTDQTADREEWFSDAADSYLFRVLDEQERNLLLKVGGVIRLEPGDVILRQGEPGDAFFYILEGDVRVSTSRGTEVIPLAELGKGSLLGEVAALTGGERTATAVALTDARLVRFPAKAFQALLDRNPKIKKLVDTVVARRAEDTIEKTLK